VGLPIIFGRGLVRVVLCWDWDEYSEPPPMVASPTCEHLPMKRYKVFDAGVDKKGLSKILSKISEFILQSSLPRTMKHYNHYAIIFPSPVGTIHPAFDLARLVVLHPDAAKSKWRGYWAEVLDGAIGICLGLEDVQKEVAVPMLKMRLVCNCYKGGSGSAGAAERLLDR
jgi:hypothetical protein